MLLPLVAAAACGAPRAATPQKHLTIATGSRALVYDVLGRALTDIYNRALPQVAVSSLLTTGSADNLRAIEDGTADMGFAQADVGFLSLREGTQNDRRPYSHIRSMGVLYINAVQVVVLNDSPIRRISDLEGRRIGASSTSSGAQVAARLILQIQDQNDRIPEPVVVDDLAASLLRREVDVGFLVSNYPVNSVTRLAQAGRVRLIPLENPLADRIRVDFPFFRPIVVPAGTYKGQDEDVQTLGVDTLFLCRSDLPDDLVYELTRLFIESLPTLARAHVTSALIDPEQAPASPIPLHAGAARFYRARELFR
jgi:TRAP transporter TAXI family solute receptor